MSENNPYSILWRQIREVLQASLSPITYNTYISKLVPVDVEDTKIVLRTDTEFFANFIGGSLLDILSVKSTLLIAAAVALLGAVTCTLAVERKKA